MHFLTVSECLLAGFLLRTGSSAAEAEFVPTTLGLISAYYYLRYTTVGKFKAGLRSAAATDSGLTFEAALRLLSDASEFDELPGEFDEPSLCLLWLCNSN